MYGPKSDMTKGRGVGQFYLVARADGAVSQDAFESELRRMSEDVVRTHLSRRRSLGSSADAKSLQRAVPPLVEGVPPQMAGDPETARAQRRVVEGIPLDAVVTDGLRDLAAAVRRPCPHAALGGTPSCPLAPNTGACLLPQHGVALELGEPDPAIAYDIRS